MREMGRTHIREKLREGIAKALALRSAVNVGQELNEQEMKKLVQDLFRCQAPSYAPTGKPTYKEISLLELETYFG